MLPRRMSDPAFRLGRYTLLGKLGAGGMGEVHLARDTRLGREVAIKILPAARASDRDLRTRFLREARAAAALNHPHIATIHDVSEEDGQVWIAFERIEGQSLADVLAARALGVDELIRLAIDLADAIAYAHSRGVIHRDIKATNVMLTLRGEPKLLDFGLAKFAAEPGDREPSNLTLDGAIVGTPGAMSPEQAQGRPVDARSDVFSFGSLLYEMATRRPAFAGTGVIEVVAAVVRGEPTPLAEARPDLPPGFVALVEKALQKDPAARHQSMADLLAELRRARGQFAGARDRLPGWRKIAPFVAALVVVGGLGWGTLHFLQGSAPEPARRSSYAGARIGVIGFENLTDPDDKEHIVRMLVPLITTGLAESGGLEVLSSARVRESMRRVLGAGGSFDAAVAREVARVAGAEVMLVGDLAQEQAGIRVVGELVDVANGQSLGSARADATSRDDLFQVAATLCASVRRQLGLSATTGGGPAFDAAAALTQSMTAWRHFTAGSLDFHVGDYPEAVRHFEAAIREDETFALAYFYLATAYDWSGRTDGRDEAVLQRGLPHVARLPARWRAAYDVAVDWSKDDFDAAFTKLTRLVAEPDVLPEVLNMMGEVVEHDARYWNPATARRVFERALAVDPTFEVVLFHLVDTLLLQGEDAAIAALVAAKRARDPSSPRAIQTELMAHIWHRRWEAAVPMADEVCRRALFMHWWFGSTVALHTGRKEQAIPLLDQGVATAPGFLRLWALHARGLAHLQTGRFDDALGDWSAATEPLGQVENRRIVRCAVSFALHRARLLELRGAMGEAVAVARAAVELVPHEARTHFWLAHLLWRHGTAAEVTATLDRFAAVRATSHNASFPFWADMLAAERALHGGDAVGARAALTRAAAHPRETRDRTVEAWVGARTAELEGNVEAAIEAYGRVVPTYAWYVENHTQLAIEARYRRACLLQDRGASAFDRADLEVIVADWGSTGLPMVADARRRLQR